MSPWFVLGGLGLAGGAFFLLKKKTSTPNTPAFVAPSGPAPAFTYAQSSQTPLSDPNAASNPAYSQANITMPDYQNPTYDSAAAQGTAAGSDAGQSIASQAASASDGGIVSTLNEVGDSMMSSLTDMFSGEPSSRRILTKYARKKAAEGRRIGQGKGW